jgi:hypothetical protein
MIAKLGETTTQIGMASFAPGPRVGLEIAISKLRSIVRCGTQTRTGGAAELTRCGGFPRECRPQKNSLDNRPI